MKLVLVVRTDLAMSLGKTCAQVAHAAVLAASAACGTPEGRGWLAQGQPKIVLAVPDLEQLQHIAEGAGRAGLPVHLVHDAGRTELLPDTVTTCAIGPAADARVDHVTGSLPLL